MHIRASRAAGHVGLGNQLPSKLFSFGFGYSCVSSFNTSRAMEADVVAVLSELRIGSLGVANMVKPTIVTNMRYINGKCVT
jgi:hypothetical protein